MTKILVLLSEGQHKGNSIHSFRGLVVDEKRIRSDHWLGSVHSKLHFTGDKQQKLSQARFFSCHPNNNVKPANVSFALKHYKRCWYLVMSDVLNGLQCFDAVGWVSGRQGSYWHWTTDFQDFPGPVKTKFQGFPGTKNRVLKDLLGYIPFTNIHIPNQLLM